MLAIATGLVIVGAIVALMGIKIFQIVLPIIGFIAGIMVGFSGVQAVFGTGAVSLSIAVLTGALIGVLMAILSFLYFEVAVAVLMAVLLANLFIYVGLVLGLSKDGFLVFLLGLSGAVMGLAIATTKPVSPALVITFTAFYGVAMIMAGVLLAAGHLSANQLNDQGVLHAVTRTVHDSFIWLFVWLGGTLLASNVQYAAVKREILNDNFAYTGK